MLDLLDALRSDVLGGRVDFIAVVANNVSTGEVDIVAAGDAAPEKMIAALVKGAYRTLRKD